MVEVKDEEDGRVALIMDKGELPFAIEALMRAGYGLTLPSEAEAEEPEAEAEEPEGLEDEEPEGLEDEEPEELEDEEPEELEDEEPEELEDEETEAEEPEEGAPVRRRGARARRLRADATIRGRSRSIR